LEEALAEYRYKVFVEQLGWDLDTHAGKERDQFDDPDTIYVVALDRSRNIIGCCRLLPTTKPYLLADVFPELLEGLPIPRAQSVWELSRFSSVDPRNSASLEQGQFYSETTGAIVRAALDCAAAHGAERLITVSTVGVERLFRGLRLAASPAAPWVPIDRRALRAYWIEVPRATVNSLQVSASIIARAG
jgi:N-acyl-L-homoserine lactone synthetase